MINMRKEKEIREELLSLEKNYNTYRGSFKKEVKGRIYILKWILQK